MAIDSCLGHLKTSSGRSECCPKVSPASSADTSIPHLTQCLPAAQDLPESDDSIDKIANEIEVAQQLQHENVLHTYAFTIARQIGNILEPYMPRDSLDSAAGDTGPADVLGSWPSAGAAPARTSRQYRRASYEVQTAGYAQSTGVLDASALAAAHAAMQATTDGFTPGSIMDSPGMVRTSNMTWAVMEWDDSNPAVAEDVEVSFSRQESSATDLVSSSLDYDTGSTAESNATWGPSRLSFSSSRQQRRNSYLSVKSWASMTSCVADNISEDGLGATVSAVVVMEYADKGCLQVRGICVVNICEGVTSLTSQSLVLWCVICHLLMMLVMMLGDDAV